MQWYIAPVMCTHVPFPCHQWPNSMLNLQKRSQCSPGSAGEHEKDSKRENRDGKEYFLLFCLAKTPPALLPP